MSLTFCYNNIILLKLSACIQIQYENGDKNLKKKIVTTLGATYAIKTRRIFDE